MNRKILLVDDDTTLLRFLGDFLRSEKMTVLTATYGQEGLRIAYREQPDLVVLDISMPGMDGWKFITRLRELSDIPIILLTGKSAEEDKLHGFNLGADDYVVKPFSFPELSARIRAVLNRNHPLPPPINFCMFGEHTLDFSRRELRCGDQIIPLTPAEYRLLETLAKNSGSAVSESVLVTAVWGPNPKNDDFNLRNFVWRIRKKIEDDPSEPKYLMTVRSYGYRLNTNN